MSMTREERDLSITYLEEIKEKYIEYEGNEIHPLPEYYAIETAIKVLEQEPCEDVINIADGRRSIPIRRVIQNLELKKTIAKHMAESEVKNEN